MPETLNARFENLKEMLFEYDETLQARVEQTVANYNSVIRNQIRVETALRLSQGDKIERKSIISNNQISLFDDDYSSRHESQSNIKTAIPVKIVDGLSKPIEAAILSIDTDYWTVFLVALLNKRLLTLSCQGLSFVEKNQVSIEMFRRWFSEETDSTIKLSAISYSQDLLTEIVQILEQQSLLLRIESMELKPDIEAELLGAYFYRSNSTRNIGSWIEIYWMSIGIIALELNVSPEALTIVTLTHELVHAYTHLGQDTDHEGWNTSFFDKADLNIVEGLAQFYTEIICLNLSSRQPDTLIAFQKLRDNQSSIYKDYSRWIGDSKKGSEMIRSVMIECRKRGVIKYDDFMEIVSRESSRVL